MNTLQFIKINENELLLNLNVDKTFKIKVSISDLQEFVQKINIDIYDPIVDKKILFKNYKIRIQEKFKKSYYDAIIIAVPHKVIKKFSINYLKSLGNKKLVIIDLKSIFPKELVQWQL